jgi:aspartate racemase
MSLMSQLLIPGIVGISTYVDYVYQREMQEVATREVGTTGPINQLRTITVTLDFNRLIVNLQRGNLGAAEEQVASAVEALAAAGADFLVVTSGTTSTLTAKARQRVPLEFLDLAHTAWAETGTAAVVGVLSTSKAAAGGIFQAAAHRSGDTLVLPQRDLAAQLDDVIFGELVHGRASDHVASVLRDAISQLAEAGAEVVILGNTDMTLVADRLTDTVVPVVDSARAHAQASARAAIAGITVDDGSGTR